MTRSVHRSSDPPLPGAPRLSGPQITAALLGAIAVYNVVQNLFLPSWTYVVVNTLLAAGVTAVALRLGMTRGDLGLERDNARSGLLVGAAVAAAVGMGLVLVAGIPMGRDLLQDARVVGVTAAGAAYEVALRIPLGTALFEEVVFRGVLLGWLLRRTSVVRAVAISSLVFGLWHAIPTWQTLDFYQDGTFRDGGLLIPATAVIGGIVLTGVAGAAFSYLRLRTASLVAPIVAHAGINSLTYLTVYLLAS